MSVIYVDGHFTVCSRVNFVFRAIKMFYIDLTTRKQLSHTWYQEPSTMQVIIAPDRINSISIYCHWGHNRHIAGITNYPMYHKNVEISLNQKVMKMSQYKGTQSFHCGSEGHMPLSPPVGSKSSHLSEILSQVNQDSRGSLPVPSSYCIILPLLTQVDLFYTRVTKRGLFHQ